MDFSQAHQDKAHHDKARHHMIVSQLAPSQVTEPSIVAAMGSVPREIFVPDARASLAYADVAHGLAQAGGRMLAAPMPFARLIQLAQIGPDDIVLDVACGSGYSTAVLAQMANSVLAIEAEQELVDTAEENLATIDIGNAAVIKTDLLSGLPKEAPFDAIVIEGVVDHVPDALLSQLRDGGRLVTALAEGSAARAYVFVKSGNQITSREAFDISLPRLPAFSKSSAFAL